MVAALLVSVLAAPAAAEQRRLHQRIIDPNHEQSPLVEQPAEGRNPAAIRLPQVELTEPRHDETLRQDEQPFQPGEPTTSQAESHQRIDQWRPDLQTARTAEQLSYHSTFTPSIAPHKRISALDQVAADYTLELASAELETVEVGGSAREDQDLFWGSVLVRFVSEQPVPVPSVSPEARILSVRTRPEAEVSFLRDLAGNFYVTSAVRGAVRLVFVTDAPSSYFGGPLPAQVRADAVPVELRPSLPPNVLAASREVWARLGLDPAAPIARNLHRLVTFLRAFENEPLGSTGVDPYLTLAFGRRGVCRHRAFVFVVTAQSLGIPARFVSNEVHAFSEVFVPTVGWVRIDLGGEARLAPESEPTIPHQPRSPDPFPWPPGTDPPAGPGRGANQIARRPGPGDDAPGASGDDGVQGEPTAAEEAQPIDVIGDQGRTPAEPGTEPEPTPPQPSRGLAVYLDRHQARVVRGAPLPLVGSVHDADGPVPFAQVTLWLRGGGSGRMIRLGRAACDADGRFRTRFGVSDSVPTGDYVIVGRGEEGVEGR